MKLDNFNIINEGTPVAGGAAPDAIRSEAFINSMHDTFIQAKKRDNIAIDISLPSTFSRPIRFPMAPIDLRNLLKPEKFADKFVNGNNMMADPVSTFNAASDIAKLCFEHANDFKESIEKQKELKFGDKKGKLNRGDKNNFFKSEAYNFNSEAYNQLNEVDAGTAFSVGAGTGNFVGNVVKNIAYAELGFGATFVAKTALLGAACYTTGVIGGALFNNVKGTPNPGGTTNTQDVIKGNIKTETKDSDASWQGINVIDAVDAYLRELGTQTESIMGHINPSLKQDFLQTIGNYINKDTKNLEEYIHNNSGIIRQIRDDADQRRQKSIESVNFKARDKADFSDMMAKLNGIESVEDIKLYQKIIKVYNNNVSSSESQKQNCNSELLQAASDGKWSDVVAVTKRYPKYFTNNSSECIQNNYNNTLNEAVENIERPSIDGETIYNDYLIKFREFAREAWPNDLKVNGIEKCRADMDKLKAGCDKEVKDKIQIVCRTMNDGSATTMTDKIKAFFSKHPLQSKYLENLWERHATELNMREENRLNQMQDFSDQTRIVGWFAYLVKNIMPEVFARIFTYRHILMILKQENIYTYTPALFEEDEKLWNDHKEELLTNINLMLLMYFKTMGGNWTNSGNTFIVQSENGGFNIDTTNIPAYLSFLIINCTRYKGSTIGANGMKTIAPIARQFVDCIYKDNLDATEFINDFIGVIKDTPICEKIMNGLGDDDDVLLKFSDTKLLNEVKKTVDSTYLLLNGGSLVANIKNAEASYSNAILQKGGEEFFNKIKSNLEKLKELKNSITERSTQEEILKVKKQIINLIGENPTVNPEKIQRIDFEASFKKTTETDRWAYVYQVFNELKINNCAKGLRSGVDTESILGICEATKTYIDILNSGILTVGQNVNESTILLKQIQHAYSNLDTNNIETLRNLIKLLFDDEYIIKFNTDAKLLTPEKVAKIIEIIESSITAPDEKLLAYNNYKKLYPELVRLDSKRDGVEDVKTLEQLLSTSNITVRDDKSFENVLSAIRAIIEYAINDVQSNTYSFESLKELLNDKTFDAEFGEPQKLFAYWYSNYYTAMDEVKKLRAVDPKDPLAAVLLSCFEYVLPTELITIFDVANKDIKIDPSFNVWHMFKDLQSSKNPDVICNIILDFKLTGDLTKDFEAHKYEIAIKLINSIKTIIDESTQWQKFKNVIKSVK